MTTLAGAHAFELRTTQGTWRGQGEIVSGQQRNITLTAHVAPTSTVATTTRPASSKEAPSSAWPWVFGTVGVVGLVGSGVFLGLGQKANTDVRNASACGPTTCFSEQTSLDRAKLYNNTLAPVSLGVGLVGSGLLTWWLLRTPTTKTTAQKSQQKHHWTGSIAPTRSGLAATVQGEF